MSESILKKTKSKFRAIGIVSEFDLKKKLVDIELKDAKGNDEGTERGECIYGNIAVQTNKGIIEFNVYFRSLSVNPNRNGNHDSQQWTMAKKMLEWTPKIGGKITYNPDNEDKEEVTIKGGNEPTIVDVQGDISINDYNSNGEVRSNLRWNINKASSKGNIEDSGCSLSAIGYISSIAPEMSGDEETGRLVVTIYGADSKGACFPIKAFVEADVAEVFTDNFEVGETINADFDLIPKTVGSVKNEKKPTFGRKAQIETSTGYSVNELILVGADPIPEPDELTYEDEDGNEVEIKTDWINPKVMKKAIKERQAMLEELKNNPPTTSKANKSSKSNKFKATKEKAKAQTSFDDDDDDEELLF